MKFGTPATSLHKKKKQIFRSLDAVHSVMQHILLETTSYVVLQLTYGLYIHTLINGHFYWPTNALNCIKLKG